MSILTRKMALEHLDSIYESGIAMQYGKYAQEFKFEMLPPDVLHTAKRILLDTVGCIIGAFSASGYSILKRTVEEWGGKAEATLLGSTEKSSVGNAALVNTFLVHYLGYNDLGGGGHNSDTIPAILAMAEKQHADGKQFLAALVLSYELGARFSEAAGGFTAYEAKGFPFDIRGGVTLPPCLGKLMGLDAKQIANAIGICASHSLPLGVLDTNREEHVHAKNLRMGFVARDAVEACQMAGHGFTGPLRVVEGDHGLKEVLLKGELDLEKLVEWSGWRIRGVRFKNLCLNSTTMGHVQTTLSIVKKYDLHPKDISTVEIGVGYREYCHTTSLTKKYPRNAETTDHSAFYANALAIRDRKYTVNAMDPENFADPVILELIDKIQIQPHPALDEWSSGAFVTIRLTDGRVLTGSCTEPYGLGETNLTDHELEEKFEELTAAWFSGEMRKSLKELIWNIELVKDIGVLPDMMAQTLRKGGV